MAGMDMRDDGDLSSMGPRHGGHGRHMYMTRYGQRSPATKRSKGRCSQHEGYH